MILSLILTLPSSVSFLSINRSVQKACAAKEGRVSRLKHCVQQKDLQRLGRRILSLK